VTEVHVVLPASVDDPRRPSGGNAYDRRVCDGLRSAGWRVREHLVGGAWPWAAHEHRAALRDAVARVPDGGVVVVDGLLASTSPEVLVPEARRVRLVVLLHMLVEDAPAPASSCDGRALERAVLTSASAVVTTSRATAERARRTHGLDESLVPVHVAVPGVAPADVAPGSTSGTRLLTVGAVTPLKGHDLLIDPLCLASRVEWTVVGSLETDPDFVASLRSRVDGRGLADRVRMLGPLVGVDLDRAYAEADLVVVPSRSEAYGMVVTEALARGIPVLAADVGGIREALGRTGSGRVPGLLVPPCDADALARALGRWLDDADLRDDLRDAALERRGELAPWSSTVARVADLLTDVAAQEAA